MWLDSNADEFYFTVRVYSHSAIVLDFLRYWTSINVNGAIQTNGTIVAIAIAQWERSIKDHSQWAIASVVTMFPLMFDTACE